MNAHFFVPLALLLVSLSASAQSNDILWMKSGHSGPVTSVAVSPDGTVLASASTDGNIKLWSVASGEYLGVMNGHRGEIYTVAFMPDGMLVSGGADSTIRFWDITTRGQQRLIRDDIAISHILCTPDGSRLVAARFDGSIRFWDVKADTVVATAAAHAAPLYPYEERSTITALALSPDGTTLASGSFQGDTLKLWDARSGALRLMTPTGGSGIVSIAFSADGLVLATASNGSWKGDTVRLWKSTTGDEIDRMFSDFRQAGVLALAFNGNDTLAIAHGDSLEIWDVKNHRRLIATSYVNTESYPRVRIDRGYRSSQPQLLVLPMTMSLVVCGVRVIETGQGPVASMIPMLDIRSLVTGEVIHELASYAGGVDEIVFDSTSSNLTTVGYDRFVEWSIPDGSLEWRSIDLGHTSDLGLSVDGLHSATYWFDSEAGFSGRVMMSGAGTVAGNLNGYYSVYPSPKAIYCAYVFQGAPYHLGGSAHAGALYVWSRQSGESKHIADSVSYVRFSYDARYLGIYFRSGRMALWNTEEGGLEWTLPPDHGSYLSMAFSHDGSMLAVGNRDDGRITIWDIATRSILRQLNGHRDAVHGLAFSRDGQFLVSSGADSTLRTWVVATGMNDYTYADYPAKHFSVTVSPDSKYIASTTSDGALILWHARGAILSAGSKRDELASNYSTLRCYPTPSNSTITIECDLAIRGNVVLQVIDQLGREVATVADGEFESGVHRFDWDCGAMPAGMYHCRLRTMSEVMTRPVVIVR